MVENSKIEWTDNTFNPWWGCTKLTGACDFCYAEVLDKRFGGDHWGAGKPRRRTSEKNWNEPRKWNRAAQASGIIPGVFCASMGDIGDSEVPDDWRQDLSILIDETPFLEYMLLTKRAHNLEKYYRKETLERCGIGATAETQKELDARWSYLKKCPARYRFLSMEPLLEAVTIRDFDGLDWVIVGGESGPNRRSINPDWVRSLRDQCVANDVAFFFKQWGGLKPKDGGRELDGQYWSQLPKQSRRVS